MSDGMEAGGDAPIGAEVEAPVSFPPGGMFVAVMTDNEEDAAILRSLADKLAQARTIATTFQKLGDKLSQSADGTLAIVSPALDAIAEASFDHQVYCLVNSIETLHRLSTVGSIFSAIQSACIDRLKGLFAPAPPVT